MDPKVHHRSRRLPQVMRPTTSIGLHMPATSTDRTGCGIQVHGAAVLLRTPHIPTHPTTSPSSPASPFIANHPPSSPIILSSARPTQPPKKHTKTMVCSLLGLGNWVLAPTSKPKAQNAGFSRSMASWSADDRQMVDGFTTVSRRLRDGY